MIPAASEGGTWEEGLCGNEEEDPDGVAGLDELGELTTDGGYHDCDCEEPSCDCCSCDPLRIIGRQKFLYAINHYHAGNSVYYHYPCSTS